MQTTIKIISVYSRALMAVSSEKEGIQSILQSDLNIEHGMDAKMIEY